MFSPVLAWTLPSSISLESIGTSVREAGLLGHLLGQGGGVVLLRSELISKSGGVNHGLLGLLLRVLGLVQKIINLSLHGVEGSLNTSLVRSGSGVDGVHLIDSVASITKLGLSLSLASLGRAQESSSLLPC